MRKPVARSCAYLKKLVERFQSFHLRHSGLKFSMREISLTCLKEAGGLEGDEQRLARWTNPNGRPSWRIPLAQVEQVVYALDGDQRDVDTLIVYRLTELENDDPTHDVVVAANWASDFTQRLDTSEDRRLLEIIRSLQDRYRERVPEDALEDALERVFVAYHEKVQSGFPDEEPDPESDRSRDRVLARLKRKLAEQPTPPPPPIPPRGDVRRATRRYLSNLAKRRP